jgi:hypothetical protein
MRTAALALALLVLAGCAATTDESASSSATGTATAAPPSGQLVNKTAPFVPTVHAFTLEGCTNYGGVFPVAMAAAQAALPEGFTPVASATDPQGGATLYAIVLACGNATVDGGRVGPALVGYAELAVTPPAKLVVDGVTDCTVPVFFASSNRALGQALGELKLGLSGPATNAGSSAVGVEGDGTYQANLALGDASLTLSMGLAGPATGSVAAGSFVVYGVQDGKVQSILKGASTAATAQQGPLLLQAPGVPVAKDARQGALGFSASGFTLSFERKPVPA